VFDSFFRGMLGYLQGGRWLWCHPVLLILSGIPFLAALIGMVSGITILFPYASSWSTSQLLPWMSGNSDFWLWVIVFWIAKGLLLVSVFMLSLVSALVIMVALASPINEYISMRVERDMLGENLPASTWGSQIKGLPKVMAGEFLKAIAVVIIPLVMLLIPGVNLFAGFVAVFLIGWDLYDYPLARRGWGFGQRFKFAAVEFWTILGFGLWLAIPVVHVFLIPLAIAGGTILNIEAMSRKGLVTIRPSWNPVLRERAK
jgi:uncharacterized protein involved in cysteine biosynthesis